MPWITCQLRTLGQKSHLSVFLIYKVHISFYNSANFEKLLSLTSSPSLILVQHFILKIQISKSLKNIHFKKQTQIPLNLCPIKNSNNPDHSADVIFSFQAFSTINSGMKWIWRRNKLALRSYTRQCSFQLRWRILLIWIISSNMVSVSFYFILQKGLSTSSFGNPRNLS